MSSSRANASAVQRRTNNPSPSKQPVNNTRYPQQQQQPVQNPKLSVSDAIALTTIRLAKVETFINNLPPLDQLEAYSNQQHQQSNCMVTENVFNSIVSRLDKLEQVDSLPLIHLLRKDFDSLRGEIQLKENKEVQLVEQVDSLPLIHSLKEEIHSLRRDFDSMRENQEVQFETKYNSITHDLKEQISELKDLVLFLQNYTLKTNQKLTDLVFQQDNIHVEEEELSQHIHDLLNSEKDETISVPITDIPEENNDNLNINI